MSKRVARVDISEELIADAMAMPEGSIIHDIVRRCGDPGIFTFLIEHPDLPEIGGGIVSQCTPTLTADYIKRPATWLTWNWNLPEVTR